MESKARLLGHPIHPMLIVFPLGLLTTAIIFDLLYLATGNGRLTDVSFYMIAAGIIGGLLAAAFGLIDWLAIPSGTRAKTVGLWHGLGNVIVTVLFIASWWLRRESPANPVGLALACSFVGGALALITAGLVVSWSTGSESASTRGQM